MQKAALFICGTMLCGMSSAVGMADMEIFIDYPAGLWDFVSDGPLDKVNTEQAHSYQKSVKFQLGSGQQATMYHTWYGEYTQNVEKLGFWVYCDTNAPGYPIFAVPRETELRTSAERGGSECSGILPVR